MSLRTRLDRLQPLSARPLSDLSEAELDAEINRLMPLVTAGAPPEIDIGRQQRTHRATESAG